jgi:excisionase family DNA binding protein
MHEDNGKTFLDIDAMADYFDVSTATLRKWIKRGNIPNETYIKVGNTYRFSRDDVVDALLNSQSEHKWVLSSDDGLLKYDDDDADA